MRGGNDDDTELFNMKRACSVFMTVALAVILSAMAVQSAAGDGGQESAALLFDVCGADNLAWHERALSGDPPWMLEVSADEETHLWDAVVCDEVHIRSYLYALKEVEVGQPLQEGMWCDAPTMTYTFHMRDGSVKTFLFQENRVCIDPQQNENDVVYAVIEKEGMEYSRIPWKG